VFANPARLLSSCVARGSPLDHTVHCACSNLHSACS